VTMDALIDLGRGSLFRFAVVLAVLGLLRHVVMTVAGLARARARAGDKSFKVGQVLCGTLARLSPLRYLVGSRRLYTLVSLAFHLGLILVPIFYLGHIRLWGRGLGLSWPALPGAIADALTLVTLGAAALLVAGRAAARTSRATSRLQDWTLPSLIALEFLSGFMLAHPARNPVGLDATMLVHVWVGDLLLVVTPFTKIAHCVLLPLSQLVVEMAWRLVPRAGHEVTKSIGKEGQPL